jgi:hypothetical protein
MAWLDKWKRKPIEVIYIILWKEEESKSDKLIIMNIMAAILLLKLPYVAVILRLLHQYTLIILKISPVIKHSIP